MSEDNINAVDNTMQENLAEQNANVESSLNEVNQDTISSEIENPQEESQTPTDAASDIQLEPIPTAATTTEEIADQAEISNEESKIPQEVELEAIEKIPEQAETVEKAGTPETPVTPETTATNHTRIENFHTDSILKEEVEKEQAPKQKENKQQAFEAIYKQLQIIKDSDKTLTATVKARVRGGLRLIYKDVPLFLPASHYYIKRSPSEAELQEAVGKELEVHIHEIQEFEEGRKAIIVTRKHVLRDQLWDTLKVGDFVEGKVTSIPNFGVFIDIGGIEGLIHISQLTQYRLDNPNKMFKKGDKVKAKVIEVDKDNSRLALSRKDLEDSPWKDIETRFPVGSTVKGVVRRITEFGAYIEIAPGIDGLLRTHEISWTKRIKRPSEVIKVGSEIDVYVLNVSEERKSISFSLKRLQPSPWPTLIEKYPIGSVYEGTVKQIVPQGAILEITPELDGFMPRSKMKPLMKGKKFPYELNQKVQVEISELNSEEESLILAPIIDNTPQQNPKDKYNKSNKNNEIDDKLKANKGSIALGDLLSEEDRKNLIGNVE